MPFNSVMAKQPFFDRYVSLTRTHYAGRQTEVRANVFAFDTRRCTLTNKHDAHITTALSPLGSICVCQSQQQYFSATRPDAVTAFLQEITRVSTQSSMPFVRVCKCRDVHILWLSCLGGISVSSSVKTMNKWHLFECKQNETALLSKLKHESCNINEICMYLQKYWVSKIINILQKCIYIDNTILEKVTYMYLHMYHSFHKNIKKHNCFQHW